MFECLTAECDHGDCSLFDSFQPYAPPKVEFFARAHQAATRTRHAFQGIAIIFQTLQVTRRFVDDRVYAACDYEVPAAIPQHVRCQQKSSVPARAIYRPKNFCTAAHPHLIPRDELFGFSLRLRRMVQPLMDFKKDPIHRPSGQKLDLRETKLP